MVKLLKNYRSIWLENSNIIIIDQTKLPFKVVLEELKTTTDFYLAIKNMKVRGAPLIGVTAAFGLAFSVKKNPNIKSINKTYDKLLSSRPTAVNLKWALDLIKEKLIIVEKKDRANLALKLAKDIYQCDINSCERIGDFGFGLINKQFLKKRRRINILTHCNAGWLAAIKWGTALSPIYKAAKNKIPIHIWVDETRPRNQGALLTAWELEQAKIPYTVIVDNAGGHLMQNGEVDMCIVGSDRTAMNGDVCNKIGTYLKAVVAKENSIPFYVALPSSTIDKRLNSGIGKIPIEYREGKELTSMRFLNENKETKILSIYLNKKNVINPAFDVTPSKFITKLITEKGICSANKKSISSLIK